jgi:hypothetical protein
VHHVVAAAVRQADVEDEEPRGGGSCRLHRFRHRPRAADRYAGFLELAGHDVEQALVVVHEEHVVTRGPEQRCVDGLSEGAVDEAAGQIDGDVIGQQLGRAQDTIAYRRTGSFSCRGCARSSRRKATPPELRGEPSSTSTATSRAARTTRAAATESGHEHVVAVPGGQGRRLACRADVDADHEHQPAEGRHHAGTRNQKELPSPSDALDADAAPVLLDDRLADGQAQPGAALLPGVGALDLLESLEDRGRGGSRARRVPGRRPSPRRVPRPRRP